MYTDEEFKKRVEELEPVAKELIMKKKPMDARKVASEMSPDDAYILGRHIGGLIEIGYHKHGNDVRGILVQALDQKIEDTQTKR